MGRDVPTPATAGTDWGAASLVLHYWDRQRAHAEQQVHLERVQNQCRSSVFTETDLFSSLHWKARRRPDLEVRQAKCSQAPKQTLSLGSPHNSISGSLSSISLPLFQEEMHAKVNIWKCWRCHTGMITSFIHKHAHFISHRPTDTYTLPSTSSPYLSHHTHIHTVINQTLEDDNHPHILEAKVFTTESLGLVHI